MSAVVVDIKTGQPIAPKVKKAHPKIVWWLKPVYWTLIIFLGVVVMASNACHLVSRLWRNDV